MKDFIEETEEDCKAQIKNQRSSGPSISKFFRATSTNSTNLNQHKRTEYVDKSALKDDFFKNLVAQLSDEEEEEESANDIETKIKFEAQNFKRKGDELVKNIIKNKGSKTSRKN